MKSYVTLEQHVCVVCGTPKDTGVILMDRRLRPTFEERTVTGWGLCDACAKRKADGYVAIVEVDPKQGGIGHDEKEVDPAAVWRTGTIAHVRKAAFSKLFNIPAPEGGVMFAPPEVLGILAKLATKEQEATGE
jgi:hypothetical protein